MAKRFVVFRNKIVQFFLQFIFLHYLKETNCYRCKRRWLASNSTFCLSFIPPLFTLNLCCWLWRQGEDSRSVSVGDDASRGTAESEVNEPNTSQRLESHDALSQVSCSTVRDKEQSSASHCHQNHSPEASSPPRTPPSVSLGESVQSSYSESQTQFKKRTHTLKKIHHHLSHLTVGCGSWSMQWESNECFNTDAFSFFWISFCLHDSRKDA